MKSETTRIFVIGLSGRMGRQIADLAVEPAFQIVGGSSRASIAQLESDLMSTAPDVVIDFSLPEATGSVVSACARAGKSLVSGVTGLSQIDYDKIHTLSQSVPVLHSANMSMGIQVLLRAIESLNAISPDFDFAIEERHHRHKKDHPSGTALLLKGHLEKSIGKKVDQVCGARLGGIVGEHAVVAASDFELIELKHTAMDRRVFAKGALVAAKWIKGKKPGLYALRDLMS